jgi:hypothetical protein
MYLVSTDPDPLLHELSIHIGSAHYFSDFMGSACQMGVIEDQTRVVYYLHSRLFINCCPATSSTVPTPPPPDKFAQCHAAFTNTPDLALHW